MEGMFLFDYIEQYYEACKYSSALHGNFAVTVLVKILPRHVMHVASCGVRPSVWVSVMFVYCVEMTKHILKPFQLSGSHTILVFLYQTLWKYSEWDCLNGRGGLG